MALITINIPEYGISESESPIVILGPNGSGKTKLAQKITSINKVNAISAQRRTWVDDSLPVQEEHQLRDNINSHQNAWRSNSWRPTEDINFILSSLIQDHSNILTQRNEDAINTNKPILPTTDTKLIVLQRLWKKLFPHRQLLIGGFFPRVKRLDIEPNPTYQLREMSDGERTVLYMAARIFTTETKIILVDEPELHMHSRLSIQFWTEIEKLKNDCRFIYITHDLNFALSRRNAIFLIAKSSDTAEALVVDNLPTSIATEVLGAATLPFFAKRIFFYEGERNKGFACDFFSTWFDDDETFAFPVGNRDSVCASVAGLKNVGVLAAEIIGLVDRDYYSDDVLMAVPEGVTVLQLHEIESIFCVNDVIKYIAEYIGKDYPLIHTTFLDRIKKEYSGQTLNAVIAKRVRARIGDLLNGAFSGAQIAQNIEETKNNHCSQFTILNLPSKVNDLFASESKRITDSITNGSIDIINLLPGKHLLNILSDVLGFKNTSELTSMLIRSLNSKTLNTGDNLCKLGEKIETVLSRYLPSRKCLVAEADIKQ